MSASDDDTTVAELRSLMQAFNEARDWGQFHTLKDLAMAVSVEANELLEIFLWKSGDAEIDMQRMCSSQRSTLRTPRASTSHRPCATRSP
jgi:hypothetical protein